MLKEDKKVEKFDEERKLTVTEDNTLLPRLNDIYTSLISKLRTNGDIPVRSTGRYHKIGVAMAASASWSDAQGVDLTAVSAGNR